MLCLAAPFRFSLSESEPFKVTAIYEQLTCQREKLNKRVSQFTCYTPYFGGMEGRISTRLTVVRSGIRSTEITTSATSSGAIFQLAATGARANPCLHCPASHR